MQCVTTLWVPINAVVCMDLWEKDGLVTTLMNAKLMLTTVVFMHHAITLSAPTYAVVW